MSTTALGSPSEVAASEPDERVGQLVDRLALRRDVGEPAGDEHHGQRDDERRDGKQRDHRPGEQSHHAAHSDGHEAAQDHPRRARLLRPGKVADKRVQTTAESASRLPTERSMPAVMMTRVMPMATMAMTAIWLAMLSRLSDLRKFGHR